MTDTKELKRLYRTACSKFYQIKTGKVLHQKAPLHYEKYIKSYVNYIQFLIDTINNEATEQDYLLSAIKELKLMNYNDKIPQDIYEYFAQQYDLEGLSIRAVQARHKIALITTKSYEYQRYQVALLGFRMQKFNQSHHMSYQVLTKQDGRIKDYVTYIKIAIKEIQNSNYTNKNLRHFFKRFKDIKQTVGALYLFYNDKYQLDALQEEIYDVQSILNNITDDASINKAPCGMYTLNLDNQHSEDMYDPWAEHTLNQYGFVGVRKKIITKNKAQSH